MELLTVTPAIAKAMLEKNIGNRPMDKRTLKCYVKQMQRGEWGITPDAIGFDVDGNLMNGQHRLQAVVESETTQQFYVIEGIPRESFTYTDEGRKRQAGDAIGIATGSRDYNKLASIVRGYLALKRDISINGTARDTAPTNREILQAYEAHKDSFDKTIQVARKCNKRLNILSLKEVGSICAYLIIEKQYEMSYVESFFEGLFFGNAKNSTVALLRDRLIKDKMSRATLKRSVKISLVAKTWNAYVAERALKVLKYTEEEGKVRFN